MFARLEKNVRGDKPSHGKKRETVEGRNSTDSEKSWNLSGSPEMRSPTNKKKKGSGACVHCVAH